jgi:type II secretory pathway component GspD/PulD (secretin)
VVTLDNQEAVIKVGQEVPFLTGQYTNTDHRRHQPADQSVPDHRAQGRRACSSP